MPSFRPYFPSFEVKSCFLGVDQFSEGSDIDYKFEWHLLLTVEIYLLFNFFLNGLLMVFMYLLRNVQSEFSLNNELKIVTVSQTGIAFLIYFLLVIFPEAEVNKSNNMQYIMALRGLLFLLVTAVIPLRQSYQPNSIIPLPINEECIKTLEMALLMPTSANYFYEYLETRGELGNALGENGKEALAFFGLYADIRTYLRLFEEQANEESKREHA